MVCPHQLNNTRDIVVYLPPSYTENTLKWFGPDSVLVMHDGQVRVLLAATMAHVAFWCEAWVQDRNVAPPPKVAIPRTLVPVAPTARLTHLDCWLAGLFSALLQNLFNDSTGATGELWVRYGLHPVLCALLVW
jgi:hypothetical protein